MLSGANHTNYGFLPYRRVIEECFDHVFNGIVEFIVEKQLEFPSLEV
jgi:hypothetical protein